MGGSSDRELGLDRSITRRDFLDGVRVALTGALLPTSAVPAFRAAQERARGGAGVDPPARTGMRGSHPGSFEVAHALVSGATWTEAVETNETYDLVVVGGGISGLAAAHFFRKRIGGPRARILVLDNHDDFGGHAKRNELWHDGRVYLMNGGTLNVEAPSQYSPVAAGLLWELGIDRTRYFRALEEVRNRDASLGLTRGLFFDAESFGADRLVAGYGTRPWAEIVAEAPLAERAKRDLVRLHDPKGLADPWPGLGSDAKKQRLARTSYRDYLLDVLGLDPQVATVLDARPMGLFVTGIDALPALYAWEMGYPGFDGLGLEPTPPERLLAEPGGQHGRESRARAESGDPDLYFPDGNATIARLLVRALHPAAVPGSTMEDVVTARVDYGRLDDADWPVRLRLRSTAVAVRHRGAPDAAREVEIVYVRDGVAERVRARACVLACWHEMIPYLCPELPAEQKKALAYGVKAPLVYTSVLLARWTSFVRAGVASVSAPRGAYQSFGLAPSLRLGAYRTSQDPDEPIVIRMARYFCAPGLSRREQHRKGRQAMLATSFESFERSLREQLARTLGPSGLDPARAVLAITVNRWPHGYTYAYNTLYDPVAWALGTPDDRPHLLARRPFGRVAIANADAAASPHTDAAIDEAYRAVVELGRRLARD